MAAASARKTAITWRVVSADGFHQADLGRALVNGRDQGVGDAGAGDEQRDKPTPPTKACKA